MNSISVNTAAYCRCIFQPFYAVRFTFSLAEADSGFYAARFTFSLAEADSGFYAVRVPFSLAEADSGFYAARVPFSLTKAGRSLHGGGLAQHGRGCPQACRWGEANLPLAVLYL